MDMKVNTDLIKQLRQAKAWSQDELAVAASLSVRTVQRVETYGTASLETKKALAAAFAIEVTMLDDRRAIEPTPQGLDRRRRRWHLRIDSHLLWLATRHPVRQRGGSVFRHHRNRDRAERRRHRVDKP
jgi:transcriptional regulator with XRE-family HTH domain